MNNDEAVPETIGVSMELLAAVELGPEIEGMQGRQLRMRMFTFEPGPSLAPFTTIRTGQESSTYSKG